MKWGSFLPNKCAWLNEKQSLIQKSMRDLFRRRISLVWCTIHTGCCCGTLTSAPESNPARVLALLVGSELRSVVSDSCFGLRILTLMRVTQAKEKWLLLPKKKNTFRRFQASDWLSLISIELSSLIFPSSEMSERSYTRTSTYSWDFPSLNCYQGRAL